MASKYIGGSDEYPVVRQTYPAIRRMHQIEMGDFTAQDRSVLEGVVLLDVDRLDRESWWRGENYVDYNVIRENPPEENIQEYVRWRRKYLIRNIHIYIWAQAETFVQSSLVGVPLSFYYHTNDMHAGRTYFANFLEEEKGGETLLVGGIPSRVTRWMMEGGHCACWQRGDAIVVSIVFGTAIPMAMLLALFVCAIYRKDRLVSAILPLVMYGATMFLLQPQPKAYYWSWLACCGNFMLVVFVYEMTKSKVEKHWNKEGDTYAHLRRRCWKDRTRHVG